MLERIRPVEGKVEALLIDAAVIKANYATRQDVESVRKELHSSIASQTKWLVAALFMVLAAGLTLAKWLF